jgi:hypothetical protein
LCLSRSTIHHQHLHVADKQLLTAKQMQPYPISSLREDTQAQIHVFEDLMLAVYDWSYTIEFVKFSFGHFAALDVPK